MTTRTKKTSSIKATMRALINIECPMGMSHTWWSQETVMRPNLRTKREG